MMHLFTGENPAVVYIARLENTAVYQRTCTPYQMKALPRNVRFG